MNSTQQLELGMRNQIRNQYRNLRGDRVKRARWWFTQMRRVVDLTLPPQPAPAARPEQTYLHLR
jgi:hypothetical protein